ncbi:MAG: nucleotidyltransferase family protein [Anaerolineales bacterium]|nr:nucleotidyltransferase family protein [Anaerolineales bacterium]
MSFVPEDKLLFHCASVQMSDKAIESALHLLQRNLDWDYILEASIRHGIAPLFYYSLRQLELIRGIYPLIPSQTIEILEILYQGSQTRNRRLYSVSEEILIAFEQAEIQVMGLKDFQLAWEIYPDIGLRPIGDIDLLIHRQDYDKVVACMSNLGFRLLPDADTPFMRKYAWAYPFHRPKDNIWVDLQWNIMQIEWAVYEKGNFDFEIDRTWRGARSMKLNHTHILVPRHEDMFFHLCMHLEGHAYSELILFCDIAELLRLYGNQMDWWYLIEIVKKYKVESSFYYILLLLQELFEASLPPYLLPELEPTHFKANIFIALFSNLTRLHYSLDEIRLAARPPNVVMQEFETTVRQQAVSAIEIYREIDQLVSTFFDASGTFILIEGSPAERFFPDPLLKPFRHLSLLVLDQDLPLIQQSLSNCGFRSTSDDEPHTYQKELVTAPRDPLLVNHPARIVIQINVDGNFTTYFQQPIAEEGSRKNAALNLVKAKIVGRSMNGNNIQAQINLIPMAPEDMLLYLCIWLSKQEGHPLFSLVSLLEFFRVYRRPLDWQRFNEKVKAYEAKEVAITGLLMVAQIIGEVQLSSFSAALGDHSPHRRVLEWARYKPDTTGQYTGYKAAFIYLISFLSTPGIQAKFSYLFRSLFGTKSSKPVLPGLIMKATTAVFSRRRKSQHLSITDLVYWIDPDVANKIAVRENR